MDQHKANFEQKFFHSSNFNDDHLFLHFIINPLFGEGSILNFEVLLHHSIFNIRYSSSFPSRIDLEGGVEADHRSTEVIHIENIADPYFIDTTSFG